MLVSVGTGVVSESVGVGSGVVGVGVGVGGGVSVGVWVGVGVGDLVEEVDRGVGDLLVEDEEGGVLVGVCVGKLGVGEGVSVSVGVYGGCERSEAVGYTLSVADGGAGTLFAGSLMHPAKRPNNGSASKYFIAITHFKQAN